MLVSCECSDAGVSDIFVSWGQSAGSISAALHMLANNGDNEGLFRGAFMQSGGPISWKTGTLEEGKNHPGPRTGFV